MSFHSLPDRPCNCRSHAQGVVARRQQRTSPLASLSQPTVNCKQFAILLGWPRQLVIWCRRHRRRRDGAASFAGRLDFLLSLGDTKEKSPAGATAGWSSSVPRSSHHRACFRRCWLHSGDRVASSNYEFDAAIRGNFCCKGDAKSRTAGRASSGTRSATRASERAPKNLDVAAPLGLARPFLIGKKGWWPRSEALGATTPRDNTGEFCNQAS
jgi:hypothetical protein